MADFPLNPTVGDVYVSSDFTNWVWDGTAWKATNYGLIKLPVSQNSTGTILANSMNFVNSEQILANISFDTPSGNANVQFEWLELVDPVAMAIIFGTGSEPNKEIVAGNTDEIMFNYSGEIRTTPELTYNIAANTLTVNTDLIVANGVTGNVGIGTANPTTALQVSYNDPTYDNPQILVLKNEAEFSKWTGIDLRLNYSPDELVSNIVFDFYGTKWGDGITTDYSHGMNYVSGRPNFGNHWFRKYDGTALLSLRESGNVGIGTTSPTSNLYVTGNATITQSLNTAVVNASSLVNTQAVYQTSTGTEVFATLTTIGLVDDSQNSAFVTTNTTFDTVNTAIETAANTVRTSVRGSLTSSAKQLNLTNTTPIQIIGTDDANGNATIAFTHATISGAQGTYAYPASIVINEFGHVVSAVQGAQPPTTQSVTNAHDAANAAANTVRTSVRGTVLSTGKQLNFTNTTPIQLDGTNDANGNATIALTHAIISGVQGTYAYPTQVIVNQFGHVTSVTAGSAPAGGTITGVQAGTGLSGGGSTGSVSLDINFNELTDFTATVDRVNDEFIMIDRSEASGTQSRRKLTSEIGVEVFNGVGAVGKNLAALASSTGVTFIRVNDLESVDLLSAADFRTAIGAGTGSGTGTVTLVGTTSPLTNSVGGSGITTSGTIGLSTSGVTAATYNYPTSITVDQFGRVTSFGVQGGAPGTGSGTVNSGTTPRFAYYPSSGTAVSDTPGVQFDSSRSELVSIANAKFTGNITDTPVITFTGGTQSSFHVTENAAGKVLLSTGTQASTTSYGLLINLLPAVHAGFALTVVRGTQGSVKIGSQGGAVIFSAGKQGVGSQGTGVQSGVQISSIFGAATILANGTNRYIVFGDISNAP